MAMAASPVTNRPRAIRKLEKPRPLNISPRSTSKPFDSSKISSVEDIVSLVQNVTVNLSNGCYDEILRANINIMCNHLKVDNRFSRDLERVYKDELDKAFVAIKKGSKDENLDIYTRCLLVELIGLRAKHWNHNELAKQNSAANNDDLGSNTSTSSLNSPLSPQNVSTPLLGPGEIVKSSGKFTKPTRITGKNYCKDEVVIRNSDSGKVNPGAKERLVQITGPTEEKIMDAKNLIKETIQRNASPVRCEQAKKESNGTGSGSTSLNSTASDDCFKSQPHSFSNIDASIEYKYTVTVGSHVLQITGNNIDLVKTAKIVLEDYFLEDSDQNGSAIEYFNFEDENPFTNSFPKNHSLNNPHMPLTPPDSNPKEVTRELSYEILMQCSKGPYAKRPPADWDRIQKECPSIVRKTPINWFEPETYKTKVATGGYVIVIPAGELDNDAE